MTKTTKSRSKWAIFGLVILALVLLGVVLSDTQQIPGQENVTRNGDKITVKIDALIDGPKECFARVQFEGETKYVILGQYPACQEHTVGEEITITEDDFDTTP
ncbi:MAG: hypothetical protein H9W81_18510 [Enterococcus sp.]|nr:hypothetical protein [Enterococcus sp.]